MLKTLPSFPFVVFDTETTGLVPKSDHIVELAIQRFEGGKKVAEYESLLKVDVEIGPVARVLTRLTDEDLQQSPRISDERAKILPLFEGAVLIGQNIWFDLDMLKGDGLDLTDRPWMDSSMLASLVFPEVQSFSLMYLSTILNLPHEPQHRAMGDVIATAALVEKVWERLSSLSEESIIQIKEYAKKGPEGYAVFFAELGSGEKKKPEWLSFASKKTRPTDTLIDMIEKDMLKKESSGNVILTVKNLETTVKHFDTTGFTTVFAPNFLPDPNSVSALLSQKIFTADELTLAIKIGLYNPSRYADFPLHGGERDVWKGKLACTLESETYRKQFSDGNLLLDHRQLLELLLDENENSSLIQKDSHIIIDDASMLEDTATKACKWHVGSDPLRAAAEGDSELTSFMDAYQIWTEKVRNSQDLRYLVSADLETREVKGLRERLDIILESDISNQSRERLLDLNRIFTRENLNGRITYIEQFRDGGQTLQSVPLNIAEELDRLLYKRYDTTLFLPVGDVSTFNSILPGEDAAHVITKELSASPFLRYSDEHITISRLLPCVDGKVVCLVNSKREIEKLAVKWMEPLEEQGIALIAQGLCGGLGRMQADFQMTQGAVVWMLTPWMYEGVDLPKQFVDHLWIHSLPFDHPKHAVLCRRGERYGRSVFDDYFVPRMLQRLFRLIRMYCKHRKDDGDILMLDQRMQTKEYGKRVMEYLQMITLH